MKNKTIFLSAGEVSGDIHAGDLILKLREHDPELKFTGLGGANMIAAGMKAITGDVSTLSSMGLTDSLRFYFRKYVLFKLCLSYLRGKNIKYLIMVDNQGFNIPLAKAAKKLGIKTFYYFPPHVSVWGRWNARILAESVDLIISPFYNDYLVYKEYTDKAIFPGHPLLDKIVITMNSPELYKKFGLDMNKKTVSILPGSRYQEVESLTDPMLGAAGTLIKNHDIQVILPISHPHFAHIIQKKLKKHGLEGKIKVVTNDSYSAMSIADVNILASGTASLESVLLHRPPIICYKISAISYFIGKIFLNVKMIGLPNIILKRKVFPELLQKKCNAGNIVKATLFYLNSSKIKDEMNDLYDEITKSLGEKPVVDKVANYVMQELSDV
jgi:lipid-A-disaccharide synthase